MEDLFKIAAGLSEPDSVDAVLSLGFVNESNKEQYISLISEFEDVISKLAKLLLSIRLGVNGDEQAVKRAMEALQETVNSLKSIRG